jgi:hypothetical protein
MATVKMTITDLNLITHWKLKVDNPSCGICRNNLCAPSKKDITVTATPSKPIDMTKDYPVLGSCGHAFHKSCIDGLTVNGGCLCPVDQSPWMLAQVLDVGVSSKHDASTTVLVKTKPIKSKGNAKPAIIKKK